MCRCCGVNVIIDPDGDSESFVSTFCTLEDVTLLLSMACDYCRLYSFVMLGTKTWNEVKFIRNRLLHPSSKEADFDHIRLCSPDKSKLDSHYQYIICAMNRVERAHEWSFNIIEAMFHLFISLNRYFFMFIHFLVNKSTSCHRRLRSFVGATMDIMVRQTVPLLILW